MRWPTAMLRAARLNATASAPAPRWPSGPASKSMPVTASNFQTAETIAALPEIVELNIGHFLIGEAILTGLAAAVRTMRAAMDRGRAKCGAPR